MSGTAVSVGSLRERFQSGIAFNSLGSVFNQGSTFVFNIIAANLLGRANFGQLAIIQTTIVMVAQIAQLGCGVTATKYIAEFRSTDKVRAGRVIALLVKFSLISASVASVVLVVAASWLAKTFFRTPGLKIPLILCATVILLSTMNGLMTGVLAGMEAYRRIARALVASGIAYLSICAAMCYLWSLTGCVLGFAVSALIQCVLLLIETSGECRDQCIPVFTSDAQSEWSVVSGFALPASLSGFTTMPAIWLSNAMLARRPDGFSQLALYGAAYTFMTAALFLPNVANSVGMSLLNFHRGDSPRTYQRTFWTNFAVVATVVIGGAAVISAFGPTLLSIFGRDFRDGYKVLLIMMIATVFQGLGAAIYQHIQSEGRMWLSFFAVALPRDSMIIVLAYFMIPLYGAIGLAIAYTAAWALCLSVIMIIVFRTKMSKAIFANA